MLGREELVTYISCEIYDKKTRKFYSGECLLKSEADKVMDAMEARINELEKALSNAVAGGNIALEQAKKLESQLTKWISVKDRFPCEDGEHQVVYKHNNGAMVASFDEWDNDFQDWMNATDRVDVVYWAELLPPPTTEEK